MKQLLIQLCTRGHFDADSSENNVSFFLLSKFLYTIGHVAIKQMVHLDTSVYKELKRRDAIRKLKKEKKSNKNNSDLNKSRISSTVVATPNSARQILRHNEVCNIVSVFA